MEDVRVCVSFFVDGVDPDCSFEDWQTKELVLQD